MGTTRRIFLTTLTLAALTPAFAAAQTPAGQTPATKPPTPPAATAAPAGVTPPEDYVIGPDDQLTIMFWREKDMSSEVVVRPDGKITLPLLNEIMASGLTPEQLRLKITDEAKRYVEEPNATVVVRQINSRKIFVTGQVAKPGPYQLSAKTTVLQLISTAGGLNEYAKSSKISIMRTENGKTVRFLFNYKDVLDGKNLKQNIELKPGDTVIVP
jgi:polysaccharide export outer membrane protein